MDSSMGSHNPFSTTSIDRVRMSNINVILAI
ncbi:MAG: hypothetical protein ACJA1A_001881 [Saprospiraceae bacterium]|jgi:hypothetical protein